MGQTTIPTGKERCRIAEIVQYNCNLTETGTGRPVLKCFPIPRIFRICPNGLATEITRGVNINFSTGEVEIPPTPDQPPLLVRPWRDISRYNQAESNGL
ncbi:hypothetical protein BD779DRAFT_1530476 [Infundibulicybe gibba]|nr:hypothetical protein BD779DRAFT_1530476 [Infundibulicybe gibba]